jgi:hypothetical protein
MPILKTAILLARHTHILDARHVLRPAAVAFPKEGKISDSGGKRKRE